MSSLIRKYKQLMIIVVAVDIKLMSDSFVVTDNNIYVVAHILLSRTTYQFRC
jgi:hypothetical protein